VPLFEHRVETWLEHWLEDGHKVAIMMMHSVSIGTGPVGLLTGCPASRFTILAELESPQL
jgi:hypothetical protein